MNRAGGRRLVAIAAIAAMGSGCVAPGPSPAPSSGPSESSPVAIRPSRPLPVATPSAGPSAPAGSPTPLPDPPELDTSISAITIVCSDWASDPPPDLVECDDAARLALAAIGGEDAAAVRRLDVGFGDPCPDSGACLAAPDVRWVVARSEGFDTLHVRVARDAAGELRVWPPVEGRPQPPPSFEPPGRQAPDLGPDAPVVLRDGPPLAFCGTEDQAQPDAFDGPARRCFLGGVEGWAGVELVSRSFSTEGQPVMAVDRFTGRGAITRFVRAAGRWTAAACAISPIDGPVVYLLVRPCEPVDVQP